MDKIIAAKKAAELVALMTAEEKMSQLSYNAPAIERLGIHAHNWWNEASHGVARSGIATVFPHAIAMAATFNPQLVGRAGDAVSTEARAKYNKSVQYDDRAINRGITYWAPNINIFRDPRWGRGQETYGEDPCLTATLGSEYIKGLQGNGEFWKSTACAKHYAVHSGPEKLRHTFDAQIRDKELYETYLPAFEYAVKNGVAGVMGAYNAFMGDPCCASDRLINQILRKQWGFDGYFVSDCGAIVDISEHHHYAEDIKHGAAVALKTGCDLNCGEAYRQLREAYEEGLVTDEDITAAAVRLYTIRFMLGEFEENRPYADVPYDKLDCPEHRAMNLEMARQCMVLLQNRDGFLPVAPGRFGKIAVVGPNAMSRIVLEGNYEGHASEYITVADGIRRVYPDSRIYVADGCNLCERDPNCWGCGALGHLHSEGLAAASEADMTVLCLGLDRNVEGEESGIHNDFTDGGDKRTLYLPETQQLLAERVCEVCENVVVVVLCGSAVDLGEKVRSRAKAIIHGWYPGAVGGLAVAQLLAGVYSPSGKLPVTFYRGDRPLPDFCEYSMEGRTYRFLREEPLYPFGFGLSYTDFAYADMVLDHCDQEKLSVRVRVTNIGKVASWEKVQLYARLTDSRTETPNYQLCAMEPVFLEAGESRVVTVSADRYWMKAVLADGSRVDPDGELTLYAGGHQPDAQSARLSGSACACLKLK